jgi:hypothetical protein
MGIVWGRPDTGSLCSKCHQRLRAKSQRWCKECRREYRRGRRPGGTDTRRDTPGDTAQGHDTHDTGGRVLDHETQAELAAGSARTRVTPQSLAALISHQHKPGSNGDVHRGPDKVPRIIKPISRMILTAFATRSRVTCRISSGILLVERTPSRP